MVPFFGGGEGTLCNTKERMGRSPYRGERWSYCIWNL